MTFFYSYFILFMPIFLSDRKTHCSFIYFLNFLLLFSRSACFTACYSLFLRKLTCFSIYLSFFISVYPYTSWLLKFLHSTVSDDFSSIPTYAELSFIKIVCPHHNIQLEERRFVDLLFFSSALQFAPQNFN